MMQQFCGVAGLGQSQPWAQAAAETLRFLDCRRAPPPRIPRSCRAGRLSSPTSPLSIAQDILPIRARDHELETFLQARRHDARLPSDVASRTWRCAPVNAYTQPVLLCATISNGSNGAVSNQTGPYSSLSTTTKSNGHNMSRSCLLVLRISGVTGIG